MNQTTILILSVLLFCPASQAAEPTKPNILESVSKPFENHK